MNFNKLIGRKDSPPEQTSNLQELPYCTLEGKNILLSREAVFDAQQRNDDRLIAAFMHHDLFLKNYASERKTLHRQRQRCLRQLNAARRRYEQNDLLLAQH